MANFIVTAQLELIADPYRTVCIYRMSMDAEARRTCMRCKREIKSSDLYKIVIYVVGEKFTEHHYEHVECPGRFST